VASSYFLPKRPRYESSFQFSFFVFCACLGKVVHSEIVYCFLLALIYDKTNKTENTLPIYQKSNQEKKKKHNTYYKHKMMASHSYSQVQELVKKRRRDLGVKFKLTQTRATLVDFLTSTAGSATSATPASSASSSVPSPASSVSASSVSASSVSASSAAASSAAASSVAASSAAPSAAQKQDLHFFIFSKSYCPHCAAAGAHARKLSKALGWMAPVQVELDQLAPEFDVAALQAKLVSVTHVNTYPQVFISNRQFLGGNREFQTFSPAKIARILQNN
jgi:glutaredoxin